MKIIRNPSPHWQRLAYLIREIARARKLHRARHDLEREATMLRAAIMRCELRHKDKAA